jgi:16S rRNA G966 N2-methylase RsmD
MIISMIQPHNPTTGKVYQGKNVPILVDCADSFGYSLGQFATFRQWLATGRSVMKGQKACARLTYFGEQETNKADGTTTKGGFASSFCVFAFEQTQPIEGFVPSDKPQDNSEVIEQALDVTPVDKPEYGKQYSLCALSQSGNWKAAEVKEPAPKSRPMFDVERVQAKIERLNLISSGLLRDRQTNTPKRLKQAMSARNEGMELQRTAQLLEAFLAALSAGTLPTNEGDALNLSEYNTSGIIKLAEEAAQKKMIPVRNGYHEYHAEGSDYTYALYTHSDLRSLLDPRKQEAAQKEQARILAENELRHSDIPGFFPTPKKVIAHMIEAVGGLNGKAVLEPSAGKGDIVLACFEEGAKHVLAFEINSKLAAYVDRVTFSGRLEDQSVEVLNEDFLSFPQQHKMFDAILMNPPFEKQAAPVHVAHALNWLAQDGKLCSVMPSNWEDQKTAQVLFDRIEQLGLNYETEVLLDGSFAGTDSFRQTGVNTCLLIVK